MYRQIPVYAKFYSGLAEVNQPCTTKFKSALFPAGWIPDTDNCLLLYNIFVRIRVSPRARIKLFEIFYCTRIHEFYYFHIFRYAH